LAVTAMKFLVVLALVAVCLPALTHAYDCDGCDLDGSWRISRDEYTNNDDEIYNQNFDGQVRWRDEWLEFQDDEDQYIDCVDSGSSSCTTLGNVARQSCKEARPERVYNIRFERQIDDYDYEVRLYVHRGFRPTEDAWDRYCRIRNELVDTDERGEVFVEHSGQFIAELKGAIGWTTEGLIDPEDDGTCAAVFRPKFVSQFCMTKNNNHKYPTEVYCAGVQSGFQSDYIKHTYGGAQTHVRYGCDQYTWDSDSNDDNLHDTCNRMYFVNKYDSQSEFEFGHVRGNDLVSETYVTTPDDFCEYTTTGVGWARSTDIQGHPCQ